MSQDIITKNDVQSIVNIQIDSRVATAKQYPRDLKKFLQNSIDTATMSEEIAESCFYALPRKKKMDNGKYENTYIKGPSIRLAEIIFPNYGNMIAETKIISTNQKTVTVEGEITDLENMTAVKGQFIENVNGTHSDAQKLAVLSAQSKLFRNLVFRTIPKSFVDQVYAQAVKHAVGNSKSLGAKAQAILKRFQALGIDKDKIFSFLNKQSENEFSAEDIENLIGVGTAIKEGTLSIDDAFTLTEENEGMDASERIKNLLETKDKSDLDKSWEGIEIKE